MFQIIGEDVANGAMALLYVVVLLMGLWLDAEHGAPLAIAACVPIGFIAWILSFRRLKVVEGTPTSRIGSAAQGYVELYGKGSSPPEFRVLSKITSLPCLWYRFTIEQKTSDNKWQTIDSGRSDESFLLDDGSGTCLVDPEHAEVLTRNHDTWTDGDWRYNEWLILPSDRVYVIGEFRTLGGDNLQLDEKRDIGELLAEWKRDKAALLERFDLDKDGQITEREWMLARAQAAREVRNRHLELRTQPGTHVVGKPGDGRLFLISNIPPEKLAWKYKTWAWVHLSVFLLSTALTAHFVAKF
jgi:hypothetical protein